VLETALSPFSRSSVAEEGERLRTDHLETVDRILRAHGVDPAGSVVAAQLYWTLYLGVLALWTKDESPNLEDTLVLLDTSVELFVATVAAQTAAEETDGT
jgi:hypothetical protein